MAGRVRTVRKVFFIVVAFFFFSYFLSSHPHFHRKKKMAALSAHIDALFLPGVAFDREGRRLGRGLGYYDAWAHRARRAAASRREEASAAEVEEEVEDPSAGPLLVGLAFSQQMMMTATATGEETAGGVAVVAVPVERHDVGLDAVAVAGEGLVATSERGRRALSAL